MEAETVKKHDEKRHLVIALVMLAILLVLAAMAWVIVDIACPATVCPFG